MLGDKLVVSRSTSSWMRTCFPESDEWERSFTPKVRVAEYFPLSMIQRGSRHRTFSRSILNWHSTRAKVIPSTSRDSESFWTPRQIGGGAFCWIGAKCYAPGTKGVQFGD